ncbi:hypothetical protein ACWOC1_00210 [Enterococcus quebecensis]|uniref:Uncharacterized protein n=1 Tax=Enterococcus quebecensis TaxID=903983 RepID=A0A1E5GQI3_9ENTE|nr:hypothetical protein [Enterococcus quebecensis]OEG14942.1 hypothetical protein BCR23_11185 [Enterococcus quebecensis]OJG74286.1 hypothetical protein RV12_GL002633 [Enterococcus quebecensis]
MDKQWSLYSVSSLVLLVLLKRTFDQGHMGLSLMLLFLLLIQVTGTVICVHQKRHKKEEVGTKVFSSEK